jgi:hypothetical protein
MVDRALTSLIQEPS